MTQGAERLEALRTALHKAARNLYEASELLRKMGHPLASCVYDSSMEALKEEENFVTQGAEV